MKYYDSDTIFSLLQYSELIPAIRNAYSKSETEITVPSRSFYNFRNSVGDKESTLLIMPAWQDRKYIGIKQVTLSPYNSRFNLPTLQGIYILFDARNGSALAMFDAKAITSRRTAAKSAVAASYLAIENAETLLVVGTGTLSTELIQAHATIQPLKKVIIWEHTPGKGYKVIEKLPGMNVKFEVVSDLEAAVFDADIISVATMSANPLIKGEWLHPGHHLDMIGAYRTDMREADDDALKRSHLYIDHDQAWYDTGDLMIPLKNGVIAKNDVHATLFELCSGQKNGRLSKDEITYFKSTGHALEDLTAALFVYQHSNQCETSSK